MQEKRDLGRWTICNKVSYRKREVEKECECVSEDISTRGIRLVTSEELSPDTVLDLCIHLAEDLSPIFAKGKVVWQSPDPGNADQRLNTGIYFADIKDRDREEIYKYAYQYKRNEITSRWWDGW